jgi:hypothetical protein
VLNAQHHAVQDQARAASSPVVDLHAAPTGSEKSRQ